ncbi:MAG: FkbM family methyltransferase [Minisyncoccia bacterium]
MDVIAFLKEGRFKSFVFTTLREEKKLPPFITSRLLSLYGLRKGHFSFVEVIRLMLPGEFRSRELQDKFWKFLDTEAKAEFSPFLTRDGSLMLYDRPFRLPLFGREGGGYHYLAILLFEVIVFDQYHIADYLKEGAVVIDAGANIGTFSAFASHIAPHAKIYAFEPAPDVFAILKENMKGLQNVSCRELGLGDAVAQKTIHGTTFEDSGLRDMREGKQASITTLDQFIQEENVPRVDFIKIDTEGYEKQILNGARETIQKWRPTIAMSAYHHPGDKKALPAILRSFVPEYACELKKGYEADLICYPRKLG